MNISDETLSVLNNFSSINGSIEIKKGSDIHTISEGKSILAKATVEEDFPRDFCVYELHKFLSAVSLVEDPVFEFENSHVNIGSKNSRRNIKYGFADPALITTPPNGGNIEFPDPDIQFLIGKEELKSILKASGVLGLPHFSINVSDGELSACVVDMTKPKESNTFDLDLNHEGQDILPQFSEDFQEEDYCMTFSVDNLKILPGNYLVEISNSGIGHFTNQDIDVEYWVAPEAQYSTILE